MIKLYGLKQCSTCKKVIKFLEANGLNIDTFIDIRNEPPSKAIIELALDSVSGQARKIMNTSGQLYREMNLKDQLTDLTESQIVDLLSQHGMLIKRPLITDGERISIGSQEQNIRQIWLS